MKEIKVVQSRLILYDPMDYSLLGSSIHGIFHARVLEWVAISFFGDLPNPGIESGSSTLQTLLSELPTLKEPNYRNEITR